MDDNQKKGNHISAFFSISSSLTYQDFQKFRLEERIKEDNDQAPTTAPTPNTTKPLLIHISGCKLNSLPHYCDLFDESACESAEENLLQPQVFIPYELWGELPEAMKQMLVEYNKKIKVGKPKPSFVLDTTNPESSEFTLLIVVLHLRNHLKLWMNLISVTQPAPLPI